MDRLEIVRRNGILSLKLPSKSNLIASAINECSGFVEESGVSDPFSPIVVVRELLSNAICHGNQNNAEKAVFIRMDRLKQDRIMIMVRDEGEGFDYRSISTQLPEEPGRQSRRGYALIYALTESVEFNKKGNQITAFVAVR